MHQIVCRLGLRARPHWGSAVSSPGPLAVFRGPTFKGREKRGGEGEMRERGREDGRGVSGGWGGERGDERGAEGWRKGVCPLL